MNETQLDALVAAVDGGPVSCDGLRASRGADGYRFETPDDRRDELSEAAFREACAANPWFVSNWHYWHRERPESTRAFLRWIERADEWSVRRRYEALADGVARGWGQLRATATIGEHGERRYDLRHEDDAGADLGALDVHADPLDARELVRYDERGRYRPLKTAPTLSGGWAFVDLDGRACARAVDLIYPATVANWHREREGDLDVDHFRETAERQTGIYDAIADLPPEAVARVAEACCVDSQCLKRRQWDEAEDAPLDVPRGDGAFPCREPCSLVVAAARRWTLLEREEPRPYTFELTPSEKEQLEALIDAVAEGRIDEIREADLSEGANRYRARYLRAKLVDDDGNLGGVPTEPASDAGDAGDDG